MRLAVFLGAALGIAAEPAAQECIDYETFMHWLGGGSDGGDDIVVVGSYAYVADYGLEVFDISTPLSPVLIGGLKLPVYGTGRLAVAGQFAYLASGDLYVIDISNPTTPFVADSMATRGQAQDVALGGSHCYVADGTAGLVIADVSNPAAPFLAGSADTPGSAQGVEVVGSRAYVADGSAGLQVVDVSNPAAPFIAGSTDTPGNAYDVAVTSGHAYVADGWPGGLQVADISAPTTPMIVGSVLVPDLPTRVELRDGTAFLLGWGGLHTVDVSDPVQPRLIGSVLTPGSSVGFTLSGSSAFVVEQAVSIGEGQGLQVVDVSNPASPQILGSIDTPDRASKVAISGGLAYVAQLPFGLQVIDISTSPPALVGSTPAGRGFDIAVSGDRACVADGEALELFDVSNPSAPTFIRTVGTPAQAVVIAGDYAYVAAGARLDIVDISNPASAAVVGSVSVDAMDVAVQGDLACVVNGCVLTSIDVSDPRAPQVLGTSDTCFGWSNSVAMSGIHAYVAATDEGPQGITYPRFYVFDISEPRAPRIIQNLRLVGSSTSDIAVSDGHAYVAEDYAGVEVIDVSIPASAHRVGSVVTPGGASGIALGGGLVCVAAGETGLHVLATQCAVVPVSIYDLAATQERNCVVVRWQTARQETESTFRVYRSRHGGLFEALTGEVESNSSRRYSFRDTPPGPDRYTYSIAEVTPAGDALLNPRVDIEVVSAAPKASFLDPCVPNPFNPVTSVRFGLADAGQMRLVVLDARGRLVRTLLSTASQPAGYYQLAWDGRDDGGQRVASGIYWLRLGLGAQTVVRSVTLIK